MGFKLFYKAGKIEVGKSNDSDQLWLKNDFGQFELTEEERAEHANVMNDDTLIVRIVINCMMKPEIVTMTKP